MLLHTKYMKYEEAVNQLVTFHPEAICNQRDKQ